MEQKDYEINEENVICELKCAKYQKKDKNFERVTDGRSMVFKENYMKMH